MRPYLSIATILSLASVIKGSQILGSFNLIPSTYHVVPQSISLSSPISHFPATGIVPAPIQEDLSHPAVVENSIAESQLPAELRNPFYKNPAIASALARESWFGHKEFPVHHREADKIPREEIYKIISRLHQV